MVSSLRQRRLLLKRPLLYSGILFQPYYCEDFICLYDLYPPLSTMSISLEEYKLRNPAIFNGYSLCIFATTSMCVVLDRKNFLGWAEIYGKNTRLYAYFCANVYRCINMQRGLKTSHLQFIDCFNRLILGIAILFMKTKPMNYLPIFLYLIF